MLDALAIVVSATALIMAVLTSMFRNAQGRPRRWLRLWVCLSLAGLVAGAMAAWRIGPFVTTILSTLIWAPLGSGFITLVFLIQDWRLNMQFEAIRRAEALSKDPGYHPKTFDGP